jgi:hypothetical protein
MGTEAVPEENNSRVEIVGIKSKLRATKRVHVIFARTEKPTWIGVHETA